MISKLCRGGINLNKTIDRGIGAAADRRTDKFTSYRIQFR